MDPFTTGGTNVTSIQNTKQTAVYSNSTNSPTPRFARKFTSKIRDVFPEGVLLFVISAFGLTLTPANRI